MRIPQLRIRIYVYYAAILATFHLRSVNHVIYEIHSGRVTHWCAVCWANKLRGWDREQPGRQVVERDIYIYRARKECESTSKLRGPWRRETRTWPSSTAPNTPGEGSEDVIAM